METVCEHCYRDSDELPANPCTGCNTADTVGCVRTIRLTGSESRESVNRSGYGLVTSAKAIMFGELLKLGYPTVQHYHGDFYHDAIWLDRAPVENDGLAFYFGFREFGTTIGIDRKLVSYGNDRLFKVILFLDWKNEYMGDWLMRYQEVMI